MSSTFLRPENDGQAPFTFRIELPFSSLMSKLSLEMESTFSFKTNVVGCVAMNCSNSATGRVTGGRRVSDIVKLMLDSEVMREWLRISWSSDAENNFFYSSSLWLLKKIHEELFYSKLFPLGLRILKASPSPIRTWTAISLSHLKFSPFTLGADSRTFRLHFRVLD